VAAATLVAVLATSGALTNLASTVAAPEMYEQVAANAANVTAGAWRSFLFVIVTAGVIFAASRGRVPHAALGWALAALVSTDLWSVLRLYWRVSPPAAQLYASDPTIEYIKRQPQPGRVLSLRLAPEAAVHDPVLTGDGLMTHGIRQVLGYHGNELGRYQTLYGAQGSLANPNFWQLYNVRYFLTNAPQLPVDSARRVVGPVKDAAGTSVYLFELPVPSQGAWVAPAIVKAPDEATLATVLDPRFPVRSTAIFDTAANVPARTDLRRPPPPLPIQPAVSRTAPGRITVTLDTPAPVGSALVVSENYFPGWSATVDGRPAGAFRADFTLIGVPLPEGARRIDLEFRDQAYERGKPITLMAVGLALLVAVGGVAVDRRRRA
jgi:hypothetical protein